MRAVFYRERSARLYDGGAFALAAGVPEAVWNVPFSLIYVAITYFMLGEQSSLPLSQLLLQFVDFSGSRRRRRSM